MNNEEPKIISYSNGFIIEKAIERILFDRTILQNKISELVTEYVNMHPGVHIDYIKTFPAAYGYDCSIGLKLQQ